MYNNSDGTYTLKLALDLSQADKDFIAKYFRILDDIYDACVNVALRRLHKLKMDSEYQKAVKEVQAANKAKKQCKEAREIIRAKHNEYGYTEYALHEKVAEMKKHYNCDGLGIHECQKQATKAWQAVEKLHYGKSKYITKHRRKDETSVEGKSNKTGLRYSNGLIMIGKNHHFPIVVNKNDEYAKQILKNPAAKYVRLLRRLEHGETKYYAQLILKGTPPEKHKFNTKSKMVLGLDVGASTVAVSSNKWVRMYALAPSLEKIDNEIRRLNRAMERSRRANNPGNYNDNGTIKRGKKLEWKESNHYKRLKTERKELYRKRAIHLKESHNKLANELLGISTNMNLETMNYRSLQSRSKKTTINKKNGKYNKKSRFGKSIANHAPSMFEDTLERKLHYVNKELHYTDTAKVRASQIDHSTGEYVKHDLGTRSFIVDGHKVQRDLYSAFITGHTYKSSAESVKPDAVNFKKCKKDFKQFIELQSQEIERIRALNNPSLNWYIKGM